VSSKTNAEMLNYWVSLCGGPSIENAGNIGDDENGAITARSGQASAENSDFNFPAGTEFLEITVARN